MATAWLARLHIWIQFEYLHLISFFWRQTYPFLSHRVTNNDVIVKYPPGHKYITGITVNLTGLTTESNMVTAMICPALGVLRGTCKYRAISADEQSWSRCKVHCTCKEYLLRPKLALSIISKLQEYLNCNQNLRKSIWFKWLQIQFCNFKRSVPIPHEFPEIGAEAPVWMMLSGITNLLYRSVSNRGIRRWNRRFSRFERAEWPEQDYIGMICLIKS